MSTQGGNCYNISPNSIHRKTIRGIANKYSEMELIKEERRRIEAERRLIEEERHKIEAERRRIETERRLIEEERHKIEAGRKCIKEAPECFQGDPKRILAVEQIAAELERNYRFILTHNDKKILIEQPAESARQYLRSILKPYIR